MAAETERNQPPPSPAEISDLKRLAASIIRAQGNRFIKELLREKKIRIGATKDDFERNLTEAIEAGRLRLSDVELWLIAVEGWGNQHVYLYRISSTLKRELTQPKIRRRVSQAGLDDAWEGSTAMAFPEEPELTSVSHTGKILSLIWQEASPGWTPTPDRSYIKQEDLDTYEYRAWRRVDRRTITRFEAHLDKELAGLFIPHPIQGQEHDEAVAQAKRVIGKLMSLQALERQLLDISVVSRNLDQKNLPTNRNPEPSVRTHKSRLRSGGAYVEFAATSKEKAYWEEAAVRDVRKSVRGSQLSAFQGTGGVFIFQKSEGPNGLSRPLRVQLYGSKKRIRLWAQMDAKEVWTILRQLADHS